MYSNVYPILLNSIIYAAFIIVFSIFLQLYNYIICT